MRHRPMITDVKNCRGKIGLMKAWKDIIGSNVNMRLGYIDVTADGKLYTTDI
jgi:hypothetical protein